MRGVATQSSPGLSDTIKIGSSKNLKQRNTETIRFVRSHVVIAIFNHVIKPRVPDWDQAAQMQLFLTDVVVMPCFHARHHVHIRGLEIKAGLWRAVMRRHAASVSVRLHHRKQQPVITQPALMPRTCRWLCNMLTTAADIKTSTLVDPVNATLSMPTCEAMAAPAVGPYPGKILTTPGGNPACQNNIGGNNL